jgi:WD40 repeat protein
MPLLHYAASVIALIGAFVVVPICRAQWQRPAPAKVFKLGDIVLSLDATEDGGLVAAGGVMDHVEYGDSSPGRVEVWTARTGKGLWKHESEAAVTLVRFLPGERRLLSVGDEIDEYNATSGRLLRSTPLKHGYGGVALSPDGRFLACVENSLARHAFVYDRKTGKIPIRLSDGRGYRFEPVTFSADSRFLVVGGSAHGHPADDSLAFIDVVNGGSTKEIKEPGYNIDGAAFSAGGKIAAILRSKVVRYSHFSVDIRSGVNGKSLIASDIPIDGGVGTIAVSPSCKYFAYTLNREASGSVIVRSVSNGTLVRALPVAKYNILNLKFTRDGSYLLAGGDDRVVWVWKMSDIVGEGVSRPKVKAKPR